MSPAARLTGAAPASSSRIDAWPPSVATTASGGASANVTAVYVMEPNLQTSIDRQARIPRFVAEAVAVGVRRLVLLSAHGVGEADDSHPLKPAEQAVRGSGVDWTILRPDWFSQNFSESF